MGTRSLGQPFSPAVSGSSEDRSQISRKTPPQQALQTLSMRLPKVMGAGVAAPQLLAGKGAARVGGGGDARVASLVRAMTSNTPPGPTPPGGGRPTTITEPNRPRRKPQPQRGSGGGVVPGEQYIPDPMAGGKRGGGAPKIDFDNRGTPEIDPNTVGGGLVDRPVAPTYTRDNNPGTTGIPFKAPTSAPRFR